MRSIASVSENFPKRSERFKIHPRFNLAMYLRGFQHLATPVWREIPLFRIGLGHF
jgi:hypothetical protein